MVLDIAGQVLLELLVERLRNVIPGDPRTYISYKEVHDALGLTMEGSTYGESLKLQGLSSLASWIYESKRPSITGIIVDKKTLLPGDGYFKLFNGGNEDFQWWKLEIINAKNFDWLPYLQEPLIGHSENGGEWSAEELRASVEAYLEMLSFQRLRQKFVKTHFYSDLSKRFNRSPKAFEWRMQNISYVLSLMGREWLHGLVPAKNVGARAAAEIEKLIFESQGIRGIYVSSDEIKVLEEMDKKKLPIPDGSSNPESISSTITQFRRSIEVKAWVLKQASGNCECCGSAAPFSRVDGFAYLEVHHVRKLADGGSDTVENAVAVCPNCHRELHYGSNAKDLIKGLYKNISRLDQGLD